MNQYKLHPTPLPGSAQEQFEYIMRLIGWSAGALAIDLNGDYYLNHDVHMHWQAYMVNKDD